MTGAGLLLQTEKWNCREVKWLPCLQSFSFLFISPSWVLDHWFPCIGSFCTTSVENSPDRGIQMFCLLFLVRILDLYSCIYPTDHFFPGCTQWQCPIQKSGTKTWMLIFFTFCLSIYTVDNKSKNLQSATYGEKNWAQHILLEDMMSFRAVSLYTTQTHLFIFPSVCWDVGSVMPKLKKGLFFIRGNVFIHLNKVQWYGTALLFLSTLAGN